ncbi:MAG: protein-glutamate O-methyltransferase CheR [Planctomycetota bacterium]
MFNIVEKTPSVSTDDMNFVCKFIQSESGVMLDASKLYLVEARLGEIARRENLLGASEVINRLRLNPTMEYRRDVINAMTTNETSFFRDQSPFESLKTDILPNLITARSNVRKLRIWSAACSTGQEAYSIAILIREYFPKLSSWNIEIVGTDISTFVLNRAKQATFTQLEVNRGLPAMLLVKYFTQSGSDWVLKDDVKKLATFRHFNLLTDLTVLGAFDLIFCRNVLIYFDIEAKRQILTQMRTMLGRESSLFLGGAETVFNVVKGYARIQTGKAVYYRPE